MKQIMEKLSIVKVSGKIFDSPEELQNFLEDFHKMGRRDFGDKKILVHGGGVKIDDMLKKFGIPVRKKAGKRITDLSVLGAMMMVSSSLNGKVVDCLNACAKRDDYSNEPYVGLPRMMLNSSKKPRGLVNYGFVGDVGRGHVDVEAISAALDGGRVPVFSPITFDRKKKLFLNSNADDVASAVAVAMTSRYRAVELVFCSDVYGVLRDKNDPSSVISAISSGYYEELKSKGVIEDGMIPKLDSAIAAAEQGVRTVRICNARNFTYCWGTFISR